ncbi:MAG: hypothetical protein ACI82Q_001432 [Nonlabens sp.]
MLGYRLLRREIGVLILMFWLKKVLFAKAAASSFCTYESSSFKNFAV